MQVISEITCMPPMQVILEITRPHAGYFGTSITCMPPMQVILGTSITWLRAYAGYLENLNGARIESTLRRGGWLCVMVTAVRNVVGV